MQHMAHATGVEVAPIDRSIPWRSSLLISLMALVVGLAAGAVIGGGLYFSIVPDCSVSREWLCGLGEVLVAMAVGAVVALVGFVWTTVRQVRRRVPPAQQTAALVAILVGPVGLSVIILMLVGLGF